CSITNDHLLYLLPAIKYRKVHHLSFSGIKRKRAIISWHQLHQKSIFAFLELAAKYTHLILSILAMHLISPPTLLFFIVRTARRDRNFNHDVVGICRHI